MTSEITDRLRQRHYNATVTRFDRIHDELAILTVRPDDGPLEFRAGQYTVLGLGGWESRLEGTQDESLTQDQSQRLIRRAYSISCPILDGERLVRAAGRDDVEFYVALVRFAEDHPPALTPRLFRLNEGDRIHLARECHGRYTLDGTATNDTIVMLATGTGEAPHNAMLAELLFAQHTGQIVSVVCSRFRKDLAYLETHRKLQQRFSNYRYLTLTTREPENLDPNHPDYVGKTYIQDFFARGDLEAEVGELDPTNTHVFLCGNPTMIGVPTHSHDLAKRFPQPTGMVELLANRGFVVDRPHEPGNVHFEKYW